MSSLPNVAARGRDAASDRGACLRDPCRGARRPKTGRCRHLVLPCVRRRLPTASLLRRAPSPVPAPRRTPVLSAAVSEPAGPPLRSVAQALVLGRLTRHRLRSPAAALRRHPPSHREHSGRSNRLRHLRVHPAARLRDTQPVVAAVWCASALVRHAGPAEVHPVGQPLDLGGRGNPARGSALLVVGRDGRGLHLCGNGPGGPLPGRPLCRRSCRWPRARDHPLGRPHAARHPQLLSRDQLLAAQPPPLRPSSGTRLPDTRQRGSPVDRVPGPRLPGREPGATAPPSGRREPVPARASLGPPPGLAVELTPLLVGRRPRRARVDRHHPPSAARVRSRPHLHEGRDLPDRLYPGRGDRLAHGLCAASRPRRPPVPDRQHRRDRLLPRPRTEPAHRADRVGPRGPARGGSRPLGPALRAECSCFPTCTPTTSPTGPRSPWSGVGIAAITPDSNGSHPSSRARSTASLRTSASAMSCSTTDSCAWPIWVFPRPSSDAQQSTDSSFSSTGATLRLQCVRSPPAVI